MEDEKRELETKVEEESADFPETEQSTTSAAESEGAATDEPEVEVTTEAAEEAPVAPEAETSADAPAETTAEATNETAKVICPKCGAENDATLAYCPKCGTKLEGAKAKAAKPEPAPEISLDQFVAEQKADEPNKFDAKAWFAKNKVAAIVAAVVIVVLGALIIPPMLATPDDLFEQGKYEEAYNKSAEEDKPAMLARICGTGDFQTAYDLAPDDETKTNILVTNLAARLCMKMPKGLDNPSSFHLKNIYWTPKGTLVVNFSGDSLNDVYAYYIVNKSDTDYEFITLVNTLEEETIYRYDTYSEKGEKAIDNAARAGIKNMKNDSSCVIDSIWVDAVNSIHDGPGLDSVALLDDVTTIYEMSN